MKIKAVIFDADGMVINKPILFSERFSKEYNVPSEQIIPFFKNEFPKCKIGQADLKNILPKYLNAWGWEKGIDEFLRYWFESENYIDNDIIFEIDKLKEKDIRCYLATDQEKYRTDYMSDSMGLSTVFDKIFSSAYIGYEKNHFSFYEKIFPVIKKDIPTLKKYQILFWDDDEEKVKIAEEFGFHVRKYKGIDDFKKVVNKL